MKPISSWMKLFIKNSEKYIITDNQALIKEYGGSVAKDHIIKKRMAFVQNKFRVLINSIIKTFNDKELKKVFVIILTSCFENRQFPLNDYYFEMEVKRMPFDFFGRLK